MCSFGFQNSSGSTPPETPRYTVSTGVSFDSLTIAELITCSVVAYLRRGSPLVVRGEIRSDGAGRWRAYLLPMQSWSNVSTSESTFPPIPRSTPLYCVTWTAKVTRARRE